MARGVRIVGGGLAGTEAAIFLADLGIPVVLQEMRPHRMTEAHQTTGLGELVCSNSFKSIDPETGPGVLKREMSAWGSNALSAAHAARIDAGVALAVDRDVFRERITQRVSEHPRITLENSEWTAPRLDSEITLLATGPLSSPAVTRWLQQATLTSDLYFYDAIAPVVATDSLDLKRLFLANRHDEGGVAAYLNSPLDREGYYAFIHELAQAPCVPLRSFEEPRYYQGCQPIEALVATGPETLRFGPMKPVGLRAPDGTAPYAVVQLRPENAQGSAYNLVGFQTKLKYGEQQRLFRMLPGLENAEFLRLGSIHRNTYVCSPRVLRADQSLKGFPSVYLAGQITGVEGYFESASSGFLAALFILSRLLERPIPVPPASCAIGALHRHVLGAWGANPTKSFQPSGIHFGLFPHPPGTPRREIAAQAAASFDTWFSGVLEMIADARHHFISVKQERRANHESRLVV